MLVLKLKLEHTIVRNAADLFHLKYHQRRTYRATILVGWVVDVVRALYSIKRGQVEKH